MAIGPALPETSLVPDNNIFTHWRNGQHYVLREIAAYQIRLKLPPTLASFTIFEALYGIEDSLVKGQISEEKSEQYRGRVKTLSRESIVLGFNEAAAAIAAYVFPRLISRLSKKKRKAPWHDLFIAATAVANGHGIATLDRQDFELIGSLLPNDLILRFANWKP